MEWVQDSKHPYITRKELYIYKFDVKTGSCMSHTSLLQPHVRLILDCLSYTNFVL